MSDDDDMIPPRCARISIQRALDTPSRTIKAVLSNDSNLTLLDHQMVEPFQSGHPSGKTSNPIEKLWGNQKSSCTHTQTQKHWANEGMATKSIDMVTINIELHTLDSSHQRVESETKTTTRNVSTASEIEPSNCSHIVLLRTKDNRKGAYRP